MQEFPFFFLILKHTETTGANIQRVLIILDRQL